MIKSSLPTRKFLLVQWFTSVPSKTLSLDFTFNLEIWTLDKMLFWGNYFNPHLEHIPEAAEFQHHIINKARCSHTNLFSRDWKKPHCFLLHAVCSNVDNHCPNAWENLSTCLCIYIDQNNMLILILFHALYSTIKHLKDPSEKHMSSLRLTSESNHEV